MGLVLQRSFAGIALGLIALCAGFQASAAPARRGPVITVIRPDADNFPNRPRLEARGPIRIADVVDGAWIGPRLADEWRPRGSQADIARSWLREEQPEWDRLRAERDERFEDAQRSFGYR